MVEIQDFEAKVYLEGVRVDFWSSFNVQSSLNQSLRLSVDLLDVGGIRTRIISGTKVQIFIKNTGFRWIDETNVPLGEFFLCFDGIVTGISFASYRNQQISLSCEGVSYFSKISQLYLTKDVRFGNIEEEKSPLVQGGINLSEITNKQQIYFNKINERINYSSEETPDFDPEFLNNLHSYVENSSFIFLEKVFGRTFSIDELAEQKQIEQEDYDLKKAFVFFLYGFAFDKDENSATSRLYGAHRRYMESSFVSEDINVVAGKADASFVPRSKALLDNDWFRMGFFQMLLSFANINSSSYQGIDFLLNTFDFYMSEQSFPSLVRKDEKDSINKFFFFPRLFSSPPPWCNILFESDCVSTSGQRQIGYEPTKGVFMKNNWMSSLTGEAYRNRSELEEDKEKQENYNTMIASLEMPQEDPNSIELRPYFTGRARDYLVYEEVLPANIHVETLNNYFALYNQTTAGMYSVSMGGSDSALGKQEEKLKQEQFIREKAKINFWDNFYSQRGFQASLNFSPFLILGHPCVIFDKFYATVGDIVSISHSFSQTAGAKTSIVLNRPRWVDFIGPSFLDVPDEKFEYHRIQEFQAHKINETYELFFATSSFVEGFQENDSQYKICSMIDDKIKELASEFGLLNERKYTEKFRETFDSKRGRSFVSEKVFFERLVGDTEGITNGYFPSVPAKEVKVKSPFCSQRQEVITLWKKMLDSGTGYLKKGTKAE